MGRWAAKESHWRASFSGHWPVTGVESAESGLASSGWNRKCPKLRHPVNNEHGHGTRSDVMVVIFREIRSPVGIVCDPAIKSSSPIVSRLSKELVLSEFRRIRTEPCWTLSSRCSISRRPGFAAQEATFRSLNRGEPCAVRTESQGGGVEGDG